MMQPNVEKIRVSYASVSADSLPQVRRGKEILGGKFDPGAMAKAV